MNSLTLVATVLILAALGRCLGLEGAWLAAAVAWAYLGALWASTCAPAHSDCGWRVGLTQIALPKYFRCRRVIVFERSTFRWRSLAPDSRWPNAS